MHDADKEKTTLAGQSLSGGFFFGAQPGRGRGWLIGKDG
jgi:hypothetical protein